MDSIVLLVAQLWKTHTHARSHTSIEKQGIHTDIGELISMAQLDIDPLILLFITIPSNYN